jgi:predicted acyl esterase
MEYEDLSLSPNYELRLAARERRVKDIYIKTDTRPHVHLWTRIVLPRGKSFDDPTANVTSVIDRSPYGYWSLEIMTLLYLDAGFAAVGQDMRGTKNSGGSFSIWHDDATDGLTTFDWLAAQPWSSGSVLSFGASADGLASYTLLDTAPKSMDAQFIIWSSSTGYPIIFPGGAYRESLATTWMQDTVRPYDAENAVLEVKTNEQPGDWWECLNMTVANDDYFTVKWPSLHWAGWYDIFLVGQLMAFEGYKNHAAPGNDNDVKIFIDPLGHCQEGAADFPRNTIAGRSALPLLMSYELFASTTTGLPFGNATENFMKYRNQIKDVTFYVLGANEDDADGNYWTTLDEFPKFKATKYQLVGGGSLVESEEKVAGDDTVASYTHDPENPIPSLGGSNLFIPCGPHDQAPNLDRDDVVLYETPVLTESLTLTGPMSAHLVVSSDAVDTDFMVKIIDHYPTGEYKLIQEGAARMRNTIFEDMKVDGVYEIDLDMWNTSYVFSAGHTVSVTVASSNYPRFSNNPNTGKLMTDETIDEDRVAAVNMILPGSYVTLPIVELSQLPRTRVIEEIDEEFGELAEFGKTLAEKFARERKE